MFYTHLIFVLLLFVFPAYGMEREQSGMSVEEFRQEFHALMNEGGYANVATTVKFLERPEDIDQARIVLIDEAGKTAQ